MSRKLRVQPLKTIVIDASRRLDPAGGRRAGGAQQPRPGGQARAPPGSATAQVFAAGLLPDPQISASIDKPVSGPDTQTAYSFSAGLDLAGLLAATNARRAAKASARQADLNLLWAEWSDAQQARQLAETVLADEARAAVLRKVAGARRRPLRCAPPGRLQHRDVTLQTNAADLAVKADAETQLLTAEHDASKARRDLNALLGLRADVTLPLVPAPPAIGYDEAAVRQALATLPDRRPDLLALKAGYAAQDANLRKAILAQFPLNNLAAAYAKDPAGTTTEGLGADAGPADLQRRPRRGAGAERHPRAAARRIPGPARPDRRRGPRRRARARRRAQAVGPAQRRRAATGEPGRGPPLAAYDRGDIDSQTYLTLSQNVLSKRADLDDKALAARLAEIALETALFLPPAESRAAP